MAFIGSSTGWCSLAQATFRVYSRENFITVGLPPPAGACTLHAQESLKLVNLCEIFTTDALW